MPNEHYGDTDMHIFLFRSKDAIKTMRIAGYYTFNQRGWTMDQQKIQRNDIPRVGRMEPEEMARSSQTVPDLSLILLGKTSISVQFQKLKAKIATMKLALRFNASVNLKITWQKSKVSFISRIHPSLARYTFRQSTGKAIGINYFVQLI